MTPVGVTPAPAVLPACLPACAAATAAPRDATRETRRARTARTEARPTAANESAAAAEPQPARAAWHGHVTRPGQWATRAGAAPRAAAGVGSAGGPEAARPAGTATGTATAGATAGVEGRGKERGRELRGCWQGQNATWQCPLCVTCCTRAHTRQGGTLILEGEES